jgi:hypothetical protein
VADRSVSVALVAKVQGFTAGIATARKATQEFSSDLDKMAKNHKEKFNQMAVATGGVGLALSAGFGLAIKSAMAFDKQMSEVGAVSDATGQSLDQLRQAALKAGKDTAVLRDGGRAGRGRARQGWHLDRLTSSAAASPARCRWLRPGRWTWPTPPRSPRRP